MPIWNIQYEWFSVGTPFQLYDSRISQTDSPKKENMFLMQPEVVYV